MGEKDETNAELFVKLGQKRFGPEIDLGNKRLLAERVQGEGYERD